MNDFDLINLLICLFQIERELQRIDEEVIKTMFNDVNVLFKIQIYRKNNSVEKFKDFLKYHKISNRIFALNWKKINSQ